MFDDYDELPERIRSALTLAGLKRENFCLAMKSSYKPNPTIPQLWIVLGTDGVVICSTHRTRGVWRTFHENSSESIVLRKTSTGDPYYEVIGPEGRHYLTLPETIEPSDLAVFEAARRRAGL